MRRLLLGLALCGLAHAASPPQLELLATPAWKGWTRPGRATEVGIQLTADAAARATLEVVAGQQTFQAELDLEPGRAARLHVPLGPAETVAASARSAGAPPQQRDIDLARSESPLLAVGLSRGGDFRVDGFHSIAVSADDLPRSAVAFEAVDALVLDATTLGALDRRQLDALLKHAATCGRIVVLNTDERLRHLLQGAGGCGDRALMIAESLPQARQLLESSLAARLPSPVSLGSVGELARPGLVVWHRAALLLAACFALTLLAAVTLSSWPLLLLTPALLSAAVLGALHFMRPPSQLLVWGEGESGAQVARYQAWQRFPGVVRERARLPIPSQLADSARPCDAQQAIRFELDPRRGHATHAEFDSRLFAQVSLCYSGSFPMTRAMAVEVRPDGSRVVRNEGPSAWPDGLLLAGGLVHDLPKLGPGAGMTLGPGTGRADRNALVRTASMRLPPDRVAALWPLELAGVVDATVESRGWLLLTATPRP